MGELEESDSPTKKSFLSRLRARSRSMANIHRERGSNNNNGSPVSKFVSGVGDFFSRKRATPPTSEANDGTVETPPPVEKSTPLEETTLTVETTSVTPAVTGDHVLSASHNNLNIFHPETDVNAYEGTSKMPSYVNISLAANGYSRSRTNLNTIFSRSGDVHNLIVNGSEVTDLTQKFKAVVFVNDKKNMVETSHHIKENASFTLPELSVEAENISTFTKLTVELQKQLQHIVELSNKKLADVSLNEDAKEALLVASGHTCILIKSKVKKMFQLLEKHQEAGGEKTVTMDDLACFWAVINIEVGNIRKQFDLVEKYRLNNWKKLSVPKPLAPTPSVKRTPVTKFTPKITPKVDSKTAKKITDTPRARPDMKAFLAQRRKELAEKNGAEEVQIIRNNANPRG